MANKRKAQLDEKKNSRKKTRVLTLLHCEIATHLGLFRLMA